MEQYIASVQITSTSASVEDAHNKVMDALMELVLLGEFDEAEVVDVLLAS